MCTYGMGDTTHKVEEHLGWHPPAKLGGQPAGQVRGENKHKTTIVSPGHTHQIKCGGIDEGSKTGGLQIVPNHWHCGLSICKASPFQSQGEL